MPDSEVEKFYRTKNRNLRFARWFILIVFGIPLALLIGSCVGAIAR